MDRAEDGLAVCGELLKEVEDGPGGLTVKTGGWFVQEEKELGFRCQLDSNGQSFALFDVET